MAYSERELLARIVQCEAGGEGQQGMMAVASVIMNRVNVSTDIHYYIADWAIAGNRLNEIGECLWYLNPFKPTCDNTFPRNGSGSFHTRLGDHCFYRPTAQYKDT